MSDYKYYGEYRFYNGIWHHIDFGRYMKVMECEDIESVINEKQYGVTPLYLVFIYFFFVESEFR